jgi:hypothetical protein
LAGGGCSLGTGLAPVAGRCGPEAAVVVSTACCPLRSSCDGAFVAGFALSSVLASALAGCCAGAPSLAASALGSRGLGVSAWGA